ncbi:MAG: UDP-3-O-(3-hydroxymyristoyl)glucosamine N-acyltransferase [Acidiferrobacterales bacterium]
MIKLSELARRFGGEVYGDPNVEIDGVASLASAGPRDISYFADKRYDHVLKTTTAGVVLLGEQDAERFTGNAWVVENPRLCFASIATLLHPRAPFQPGKHPMASVDPTATVANSAWLGPHSVIEAGAVIGEDVFLGSTCHVGARARVDKGTWLTVRVVIGHDCTIGENCTIHPGAVIGSDGFGYVSDGQRWVKVPQIGGVRIGNDVEIGANTTIDRGTLDDTVIGDGVKLDNLIQIGHNVCVGDYTAMAAQVGVAGSTHIGKHCTIAGQAGISDNLEIADGVHITARSLVTKSITQSGVYSSGFRAQPAAKWRRNVTRFSQLDDMAKRLRLLEQEVQRLLK